MTIVDKFHQRFLIIPLALIVVVFAAHDLRAADEPADADVRVQERISELNGAALEGDFAAVKALLKRDPALLSDPALRKRSLSLHNAARGNHVEVIRFLLEHGMDVNAQRPSWVYGTPLHSAAAHGSLEAVKELVRQGADVKARERTFGTGRGIDRVSVLGTAAATGHLPTVEFLLEQGAPARYGRGEDAETALHHAAIARGLLIEQEQDRLWFSNAKVIDRLVREVGDVNDQSMPYFLGMTPLQVAARFDRPGVVKHLLENYPKVEPNRRDKRGDSALHNLVPGAGIHLSEREAETKVAIIRLLLEHGADPRIKNNRGQTPLDEARELVGAETVIEALTTRPDVPRNETKN